MSELTTWLVGNKEVLGGLLGAVAGYVVGLTQNIGKVRTDLAFIKGQLSQVLKMAGDVDKLKERHVILSKDHQKTRKDVDAAHVSLRELRATSINR